jgi:hypothetical protein
MADYAQTGNRWTMILLRKPQPDGPDLYERVPFDLCRFNVDTDPSATPQIVPLGGEPATQTPDGGKVYERIWFVDVVPWRPEAGGGVEMHITGG